VAKKEPDPGLPDQIGPLLRASTRTYGRRTDPLYIEIQGGTSNERVALPLMATLRSVRSTWHDAVREVPLVPLGLFTVATCALQLSRGGFIEAGLVAVMAGSFAFVKLVLGKRPTMTFLAIDDHVDLRIESGQLRQLLRFDHVIDARVGEPAVVGTEKVADVLEIVTRDNGKAIVRPDEWAIKIDRPTLTTLSYALKIATGLEAPPAPKPKVIERPVVTRAPLLVEKGCPHTKESLEHEPGPLDLERCHACRGALVPAHQVHELVENRLGLTKADLDDIAAQFGGLATLCVACGGRMRPVRLRGVYVHMCRGCGAMWLDDGEDRAFLSLYGEGLHH
jgi:hypothetical protein